MTTEGKTDLAGLPERLRAIARSMGTVASVLERKREHWSQDEADQHRMVTQWRALASACADELAVALVQGKTQGWQPIATNPKDGAQFWAYAESLIDLDFNPKGIVEACFDGERFIGAVWNGQSDIWNTLPIEPTHWMPLPAPPTGETP